MQIVAKVFDCAQIFENVRDIGSLVEVMLSCSVPKMKNKLQKIFQDSFLRRQENWGQFPKVISVATPIVNAVDNDGDHFSFTYHGEGAGGTWETADGTGKYEGLGGSGTHKGEAGLPDGFIASFTGQNSFD